MVAISPYLILVLYILRIMIIELYGKLRFLLSKEEREVVKKCLELIMLLSYRDPCRALDVAKYTLMFLWEKEENKKRQILRILKGILKIFRWLLTSY